LFPVFKLLAGAGFFVFFLLLIGFLKGLFDFLGPLVEDLLKVSDNLTVGALSGVNVLGVFLPS